MVVHVYTDILQATLLKLTLMHEIVDNFLCRSVASPELQKMLEALEEDEASGKPVLLIEEKESQQKANGKADMMVGQTKGTDSVHKREQEREPDPPFGPAILPDCADEDDLEGRLLQLQIQDLMVDNTSERGEGLHAGML